MSSSALANAFPDHRSAFVGYRPRVGGEIVLRGIPRHEVVTASALPRLSVDDQGEDDESLVAG